MSFEMCANSNKRHDIEIQVENIQTKTDTPNEVLFIVRFISCS